jgi:hypothetical protein
MRRAMASPPPAPDRPIFIVAPPRCGTTLLYECLVSHPDVGFFNRANRNWPDSPRLAHWITKVGGKLGVYRDTPREVALALVPLLRRPRQRRRRRARRAVRGARLVLGADRGGAAAALARRRYASKLPAHSVQLPFLAALFPTRSSSSRCATGGRSSRRPVVKRARDYPGAWFGVRMPGWQEQAKRPPHLGAAWQYRVVHDYLEQQAPRFPGRFLPVHYEQLVAQPEATMRRVFDILRAALRRRAARAAAGDPAGARALEGRR